MIETARCNFCEAASATQKIFHFGRHEKDICNLCYETKEHRRGTGAIDAPDYLNKNEVMTYE